MSDATDFKANLRGLELRSFEAAYWHACREHVAAEAFELAKKALTIYRATVGRVTQRLTCCVCDEFAGHWFQHWNRDDGFGVCRRCFDWVSTRGTSEGVPNPDELERLYGVEGVNYARAYQDVTTIVVHTRPDRMGRQQFTRMWTEADGVYRPEPSNGDGLPVGYRRGQVFFARVADFVRTTDVVVDESR